MLRLALEAMMLLKNAGDVVEEKGMGKTQGTGTELAADSGHSGPSN